MAQTEKLTQFALSETDEGYLLQIEGDQGGTLTLETSPEQIDAIIDALDALLSEDDAEIDAVDDED